MRWEKSMEDGYGMMAVKTGLDERGVARGEMVRRRKVMRLGGDMGV